MRRTLTRTIAALLTLAALAVLLAAPGSAPTVTAQQEPTLILTTDDNGTIVRLRVGEVLQVELPEDPAGEQMWLLYPRETLAQADVVIGDVWAVGPAASAGFVVGDRILELDGEPVESTNGLLATLEDNPGATVPVLIQRGEEQITLDLTLESFENPPIERPILVDFMEDMPAAEAGFAAGDVLLQINGEDITSITTLQTTVAEHDGEPVIITVMRGAEKLDLTVTPQPDPDGIVRIGISIIALDYSLAGLGLADLNVETYIGVRPFQALIPMPDDVPYVFKLAQLGIPRQQAASAPGEPNLSIWQFEGIQAGRAVLSLLRIDPTSDSDEFLPEQFFEVLVEVAPEPGLAA